jgi:hypothetical protein
VRTWNLTWIWMIWRIKPWRVFKAKAVPLRATKALGGGERSYSSYLFSTLALGGCEWLALRPSCSLPPGKGPPGTHWTGGWVVPRAGLDTEARGKILPGIEPVVDCFSFKSDI